MNLTGGEEKEHTMLVRTTQKSWRYAFFILTLLVGMALVIVGDVSAMRADRVGSSTRQTTALQEKTGVSTIPEFGSGFSAVPITEKPVTAQYLKPDDPIDFRVDDGSFEASIGFGSSTTERAAIWLNRFSPNPAQYPITLQTISIF